VDPGRGNNPPILIFDILTISGILYIDAPTNSLNRHYGTEGFERIISDLRGCRIVKSQGDDGKPVLNVKVPSTSADVILRPPTPDFDKWFAALYRWRTVSHSPSSLSLKSSASNKVIISCDVVNDIVHESFYAGCDAAA